MLSWVSPFKEALISKNYIFDILNVMPTSNLKLSILTFVQTLTDLARAPPGGK